MAGGRRRRGRLGGAVLASGLMHAGVVAFFWFAAADAVRLPEMRVYSVNIVSPPPQMEGEPTPAVPEPEAPAAEPEPSPPEPEPTPPAPKPAEPKPAPPKEQPKPKPEPAKPPPKPAAKPPAKEQPKPAEPKPAEPKPAEPKPAESKPAAPTPSRGRNASASSAGGEGLNVKIEGVEFADPAYLQNIIRQVQRYFRPPAGARADVAEVLFWINRDGSVGDIQLVTSAGSFAFRAAAMEAVEQAGLAKAFGPLPSGYPADRLPVSFEFKPAR